MGQQSNFGGTFRPGAHGGTWPTHLIRSLECHSTPHLHPCKHCLQRHWERRAIQCLRVMEMFRVMRAGGSCSPHRLALVVGLGIFIEAPSPLCYQPPEEQTKAHRLCQSKHQAASVQAFFIPHEAYQSNAVLSGMALAALATGAHDRLAQR